MISRAFRRLQTNEHGFGLVELLIALTVMNIAIFALYGVFSAGTFSILRAKRISTATTLGEKQMELYRGMLWADVGLDSTQLATTDATHQSDADWVSQASQYAAASCTSSAAPECQPTRLAVVGPDGLQYRIDTYVRVLSSGGGGVPSGRDVKRVTVTVRKNDAQTQVLARLTTTFDRSTGCDPSAPSTC